MSSRGLRRKLDIETGWKTGEGLAVEGRAHVPPLAVGRKKDTGTIGRLSLHFDETGERLRLYAYDPWSIRTLVEITLDAKAFEVTLAKAKSNPLARTAAMRSSREGAA